MTESLKAQIQAMEDTRMADNFKDTSLSQVLRGSDRGSITGVTAGPATLNVGATTLKQGTGDMGQASAQKLLVDENTETVTHQ